MLLKSFLVSVLHPPFIHSFSNSLFNKCIFSASYEPSVLLCPGDTRMTVLPSKNLHLVAGVGGWGELINHNYKNCFAGKVQSAKCSGGDSGRLCSLLAVDLGQVSEGLCVVPEILHKTVVRVKELAHVATCGVL